MNKYQDVTKKLANSGMGNLLSKVSVETQISKEDEISEIPIPSTMIQDNTNTEIWIDEQALNEYVKMVKEINQDETAKEYPFAMLGHNTQMEGKDVIFFDQLVYCYDKQEELDGKVVNFDTNILEQVVDDKTHDVISIGHTHPLLKDEDIQDKMATNLSDDLKDDFGIQRPGLNVSLQDFYQFDELAKQIKDKKLLQCVIQHDGEIVMIDDNNGKYEKFVDIIGFKDDKEVRLHTRPYVGEKTRQKEQEQKTDKQEQSKEDEFDRDDI